MILRVLENVQQATIQPIVEKFVQKGTLINTDEYNIDSRLSEWGYEHKSVCHGMGEYARDEDGDGLHEVHVNTMEGVWSLLRSWLRPHRGPCIRDWFRSVCRFMSVFSSSFTTFDGYETPS